MSTLMVELPARPTMIADEREVKSDRPRNPTSPITLPPLRGPDAEKPDVSESPARLRLISRLLGLADTYRETGSLRQSIELYFELVREHSATPQAVMAEDRLMEIAESYELAGELRQARGIYEHLL